MLLVFANGQPMTGLLPTVAMITTAICNVFIGLNISCVDVIANVIYEYDQTKSFHGLRQFVLIISWVGDWMRQLKFEQAIASPKSRGHI